MGRVDGGADCGDRLWGGAGRDPLGGGEFPGTRGVQRNADADCRGSNPGIYSDAQEFARDQPALMRFVCKNMSYLVGALGHFSGTAGNCVRADKT